MTCLDSSLIRALPCGHAQLLMKRGKPEINLVPHGCYTINSGKWGFTAILYVLIEGISMLKLRCPDCRFWYNHIISPYQCPDVDPARGLSAFLESQLIVPDNFKAGDDQAAGCSEVQTIEILDVIEQVGACATRKPLKI